MAEAHQPLAAVEDLLDIALRISGPLDLVEHLKDARRRATVKRAGERADRP